MSQIQSGWKFRVYFCLGHNNWSRRVTESKESGDPAGLCFVGVYGKRVVATPARMRYMIGAAADGTFIRNIDDIENKRRVHGNRRMQAARRLPRTIADSADEL